MLRAQRSRAQWQQLIEQQQTGELTVSEFRAKHNLSSSNFYHWRKKLNLKDSGQADNNDDWQAVNHSAANRSIN